AINSATLEPYPYLLPVDRGLQADLLETVLRAGARAVALDFYYTKATIKDADDRLQRALAAASGKLILAAYENTGAVKDAQLAYQYAFLGQYSAPVYLDLRPDRDNVVRSRAPPPPGRYRESFSARLAAATGHKARHARSDRVATAARRRWPH